MSGQQYSGPGNDHTLGLNRSLRTWIAATALLAFALVSVSALPVARAQLIPGTDCGCTATGAFVDANPGKRPYIGANGDSAASNPKYHVESLVLGGPVDVIRNDTGETVHTTYGLSWGFSPDQDRFLIWTGPGPLFQAELWDLAATPPASRAIFAGDYVSRRFRFSNDGRFLQMAGLRYVASTQEVHLVYVHAATGAIPLDTSFQFSSPTDSIENDSEVAGWGYGPDPSRIVYSYLSSPGGQPMVAMHNLDGASQVRLVDFPFVIGSNEFWQFNPCGDVFGIVYWNPGTNQAEVYVRRTSDGASIGIGDTSFPVPFAAGAVSLSTTPTQHQAEAPSLGATIDLAANTAQEVCANSPPTADFSTSGILEAGQTITFTDASSDPDGTIISWSWDFGDGTTSSLQSPTHVYAAGGAYSATLTVTDNDGQTGSQTRTLRLCSAAAASSGKLLFGQYSALSNGNLFALNMDGSGLVEIFDNDGMNLGQQSNAVVDADYSPDGSKIAWLDSRQLPGSESGLFVSNADGSNRTLLVPFTSQFMLIYRPRWTPDGRSIAFYLRDIAGTTTPRHGIYLVDADGSNMRLVHQNFIQNASSPYHLTYPGGFSPVPAPSCVSGSDGCWTLALEYSDGPYSGGGKTQIYKIQGDGTGFERITPGIWEHSPRYSPDGAKIAFLRGVSPPYELYVMNADGTGAHPVGTTEGDTSDQNPVWSPDGTQIALTRWPYPSVMGNQPNVVVMNADGCHATTVALSSAVFSWAAGSETQGPGNISGRVFFGSQFWDPSAAGITVTAVWNGGSASVQTAADGSYFIGGIPIGVTVTSISPTYPGYVWYWPGPLAGAAGYTFPNFAGNAYGVYLGMKLDHWTLQGTVRDGDGNPLPGITIAVSGPPTAVAPVTTGADGSFSFALPPNLGANGYTVMPVTAGFDYTPPSVLLFGSYGVTVTQDFTAIPIPPLVVTPTIPGGTYVTPQRVGFVTNRPATVHYTTDDTPATTLSPEYVGPILISSTTTIHYIGVDSAGIASADAAVTYTFPSGGSLWAWGSNGSGQLGDGSVDATLPSGMTPVQVIDRTGLTGVRAVAGGKDWSVAVKTDGTVWAWGNNASGQLGNGTTDDSPTPTPVSTASGLGNVSAVAAGGGHTVALDANGDVWSWGLNANGQLGDGTTTAQRSTPVRVTGLSNVTAIAAGPSTTLAVDGDGNVWEWGAPIFAYSTSNNRYAPAQVSGLPRVTAVAAGGNFAVALAEDNHVWAWGDGAGYGQLGDGTGTPRTTPVQVVADDLGDPLSNIVSIAAGISHAVALARDGTLWAWGWNEFGQLGAVTPPFYPGCCGLPVIYRSLIAIQVTGIAEASAVAAGHLHTVALKRDGTVWAWGAWAANDFPNSVTASSQTPVQMSSLANGAAVSAGFDHSLAIVGSPVTTALLSFPADPVFATDGLDPNAGTVQTEFTYKVVYTRTANPASVSVNVCIDNLCNPMLPDTAAADPLLSDGDFTNGEQYVFTTPSRFFAAGPHTYRFEASDGATLPPSGDLAGPTVSNLVITSSSLPDGVQGEQYDAPPLSASGGATPYAWSASGLPAGLTIDPATGAISGVAPLAGIYTFDVSVTDADGYVYQLTFQLTVNLYATPPPVQNFEIVDLTPGRAWSMPTALNNAGDVAGISLGTSGGQQQAFLYSNGVTTDLGSLGWDQSYPTALNNSGQVVGYLRMNTFSDYHAFSYSGTVMTDLLDNPGFVSAAYAVNDAGQVAGFSALAGTFSQSHAFLYSGGIMLDLNGLLVNATYSVAKAINGSGQVVGCYGTTTYQQRAFLYSNGTMTDLGTLGGAGSCALAINDDGLVAGYSTTASGAGHAFIFDEINGMRDLGTVQGIDNYYGEGINVRGDVTGRARTYAPNFTAYRAFLYDNTSGIRDLGTLGGPSTCYLTIPALNSAGQVVGESTTADGAYHAFLYDGGVMKLMSTLSPDWQVLSGAVDINDSGQIAGYGVFKNGTLHAFVTRPAPAAQADVAASVAATPDPVGVGKLVTITATVTNNGPDTATGLELLLSSEVLTDAVKFTSLVVNAGPWTCGGVGEDNQMHCTLDSLAAHTSTEVQIEARPTLAAAPFPSGNSVGVSASVSAAETDPDPGNNHPQRYFFSVFRPQADVGVTVDALPNPVAMGQPVTIKATVTNGGPNTATGLRLTLSTEVLTGNRFEAVTVDPGSWTQDAVDPTLFTLADLPAHSNGTVTITATPSGAAWWLPGDNSVGVSASVLAAESDPIPGNNAPPRYFFSVYRPSADLSVALAAVPDPVTVGQEVEITATVTNAGPDEATGVKVTLPPQVPTGSTFTGLSVTPSQGSCGPVVVGAAIECQLGALAKTPTGEIGATVTIRARPTAAVAVFPTGNSVRMIADVSADDPDPATGDNHAEGSFSVNQSNAPTVTVSTPTPIARAGGGARFLFTRTGSLSGALRVAYSVGGTAAAGSDYETLTGNFTIPAGAASGSLSFGVFADTQPEEDETVILTIDPDPKYLVGAPESATVTIRTNKPPQVTISAPTPTAGENPLSPGVFRVSRTAPTRLALPVFYKVGGNATRGSDYALPSNSVVIPAGAGSVDIPIVPVDDALAEAPETVVLTLAAGAGYALGPAAQRSATVTILSDEVPAVSVSASTAVVLAGSTRSYFRFTRTGDKSGALTVGYSLGGTAVMLSDYGYLSGSVTIPAGSAFASVYLATYGDRPAYPEEDETVEVTVSPGANYTVGAPGSAAMTIRPDLPSRVTISAPTPTAGENPQSAGVLRVSRTAPTRLALPVFYTVSGTATRGSDYALPLNNAVIPAGAASLDIPIVPVDDALAEAPETVVLKLAAGVGYDLGPAAQLSATVTILSDEVPAVSVSASTAVILAGSTRSYFRFTRTGDVSGALTVGYSLGGTAVMTSDYGYLSGSVTIPAGVASAAVYLATYGDRPAYPEEDETVEVTVSPGADYAVGTPASATMTIRPNLPSRVTISASTPTASENPQSAGVLRVSRTAPTRLALEVFYTVAGSATRVLDYALASNSVVIPAGAASVDVPIVPVDDALVESPESVVLTLVAGVDYDLGPAAQLRAGVTILSDEVPAISVSALGSPANEGTPRTAKGFRFGRTGGLNAPLTVSFFRGGTATAGTDYADFPLELTFPAGQAVANIFLSVINDTLPEPNETVTLELRRSSTYSFAAPGTAEVVIVSNE